MILGIDEVGRGPWAGPLVVGAVVLGGVEIDGLTDSKKLSKKRREALDIVIRESAAVGLGWVAAEEIDKIGLSAALVLATKRAVKQIRVPYHEIIIDGTINFLADTTKGKYVTTLKKADLLIPSVSAASIVAKVARDTYMAEQDAVFPGYGFRSHVGYGTAIHRAAIEKLGVTTLHRLSFAPLAKYRKTTSNRTLVADVSENEQNQKSTSKKIGDLAEDIAARYLDKLDHKILERNWKTKYCEIDIVSQRNGTTYFTERRQPRQGGGLAAITRQKLHKMGFAAKVYASYRKLNDIDMKLAVISLTGEPPEVETFLELE